MKWIKRCCLLLIGIFVLFETNAQSQVVIRGKITDQATKEPLISVNVTEIDQNNRVVGGVMTNIDGIYVLKVKSPKNKISVSYLGYRKQIVPINNKTSINIALEEDDNRLGEVSIVAKRKHGEGGFKLEKREISGSFQTISSKEFEGVQVNSLEDALQGRIAGLDIVASSGNPGAGMSMKVRGTSSINGNTQPLIVLNGIIYETDTQNFDFSTANNEDYGNLLNVNPEDIEEISVLKDAAMTAIYGSRGANGVLLIKTKRGLVGPPRVQYNLKLSRSAIPDGINLLNGDDYTMLMKQGYFNVEHNGAAGNIPEFNYRPTFSEYENYNNNTDWVAAITSKSLTHNHTLSITGGGDRATYRISGSYMDQKGTVIGTRYQRFSVTSAMDYIVSSRIKFMTDVSYNYGNNDQDYGYGGKDLLGIAYKKMPNLSIYKQDENGNDTDMYYNILNSSNLNPSQKNLPNPVALAHLAKNNEKNYRFIPTLRLQLDFLNPEEHYLRYNGYIQFDINNTKTRKFLPKELRDIGFDNSESNRAYSENNESMGIKTENELTWMPNFLGENHKLTLNAKFQTWTSNYTSQVEEAYGLPGGITDPTVDARLDKINGGSGYSHGLAFVAQAAYTLYKTFSFNFSVRTDASTRFGKSHRFGTFPSLGGRWNIIDEPFMEICRSFMSTLAVRGSWGNTGNAPSQDYLHYSRYATYNGGYMGSPAIRPVNLQLTDLRWEKVMKTNIGLSLGFLDEKITAEFDYYNNKTSDLLFRDLGIPSTSGYSSISWINAGVMRNKGWEINFRAQDFIKVKNFSITVAFNMANNVNVIESLNPDALASYNKDFTYENGKYLELVQLKNPRGSIYGFKYKGVYQYSEYVPGIQENAPVARDENGNIMFDKNGIPKPMYFAYGKKDYKFQGGDAIYEDINHDGNIDENDIVYLGSVNPKLNGGLTLNFGYDTPIGRFSCNTFFNYRFGNKVVNMARMNAENMYSNDNQSIATNWRWRKEGDQTDMPRALYNAGYNWLGSDRYVENGSFCRFKYLSLQYTVKPKLIKKYGLNQLSLYWTFNNLMEWSKYTGVDPEKDGYDNAQTPRSKDWTLGVSIGF